MIFHKSCHFLYENDGDKHVYLGRWEVSLETTSTTLYGRLYVSQRLEETRFGSCADYLNLICSERSRMEKIWRLVNARTGQTQSWAARGDVQ